MTDCGACKCHSYGDLISGDIVYDQRVGECESVEVVMWCLALRVRFGLYKY